MALLVAETEFPLNIVGTASTETKMLESMRFVPPFLGLVVVSDELGTLGIWVSDADRRRELRILSSTVNQNMTLPIGTGWSYGTISSDELFASADPVQAVVDASYHTETQEGTTTHFLKIVHALHQDFSPPR
jgi:hypothetical protein